jgi:hypothetical protein
VCEGRFIPFRLVVRLDGREILDEVVQPPGARGDRPLSVHREVPVAPGRHRVSVRWGPVEETGAGRTLDLEADLALESRDVSLITYDPNNRSLVARGRGVADLGITGIPSAPLKEPNR